jgi:hypothetical protein
MANHLANGKRLAASQLGYHGSGVPDSATIHALQEEYCRSVMAAGLPQDIRMKLDRMRAVASKALHGDENNLRECEIVRAFDEVIEISSELTPILHFRVDDIDWNS